MGNEEVKNYLSGSHGEGLRVEESSVLIERPLEVGESLGVVEEGEIVDIDGDDPFPFLQGIEDLLKKPMWNKVIEQVCGELEGMCKEIKEDKEIEW